MLRRHRASRNKHTRLCTDGRSRTQPSLYFIQTITAEMSLELQQDVLINKLRLIPNVYNLASVSVYLPVSGIAHCVLFTFTVEGQISGCTFVSRIWARARTPQLLFSVTVSVIRVKHAPVLHALVSGRCIKLLPVLRLTGTGHFPPSSVNSK